MYDKRKNSTIYKLSGLVVLIFVLIITNTSCEKEVNIDLDAGEPRLVVEGAIETGLPPYVILTKSIGYFAKIDLATLQNSFVHDATVIVSDGTNTDTLVEYTVDTGGYKFSAYSIKPLSFMRGEVNKHYKLTIIHEGNVYEAGTSIPNPEPVDSLWAKSLKDPGDLGDSARRLYIAFKDPDTIGNYYRYFTQTNNEPFFPGLNSVYEDQIFNGSRFDSLNIDIGRSRADTLDFRTIGITYSGDTVTLKWCAIDKQTFQFFSTYEYALGTIGSPFATPIKVKTNISNGALGIWAGYGSTYKTLFVQ